MSEISEYSLHLEKGLGEVCETLRLLIERHLAADTGKLYHGAPVWFSDGNPIVGYSLKKNGIALLFWSGQSFEGIGLIAVGKFKAAEISYKNVGEIDAEKVALWLMEARSVIWNYKDLRHNEGVLSLLE